jgi:hypothetical protein
MIEIPIVANFKSMFLVNMIDTKLIAAIIIPKIIRGSQYLSLFLELSTFMWIPKATCPYLTSHAI